MTWIVKDGIRWWSGGIDSEGHQFFKVRIRTQGDSPLDGPNTHVYTPGLPTAGSIWTFENVPQPWAWCDGADELTPVGPTGDGDRIEFYDHTFTYSTRPRGQRAGGPSGGPSGGTKDDRGAAKKCADAQIADPLSEPPRTSGGSVRDKALARYDKDGRPLRNTAFEPLVGSDAEFDQSRGTVTVEQNVVNLELDLCQGMVDTLNDAPLWGLPARYWKLSEWHWDRKLYGACFFYYTRRFTFESSIVWDTGVRQTGWDRYVLDRATMCLNGKWDDLSGGGKKYTILQFRDGTIPDFSNPAHYKRIPDPGGVGTAPPMILSESNRGAPTTSLTDFHKILIQKYSESNFLLLGVPTSL